MMTDLREEDEGEPCPVKYGEQSKYSITAKE